MPEDDTAAGASRRPRAGRRLAAVVSLAVLAAAAVFLLIGAVLNAGAVALAFVSLLICATAGWYAVSRRGVVRVIALVVMVAALAGLGIGLSYADINCWLALLIVVLGGVSVKP